MVDPQRPREESHRVFNFSKIINAEPPIQGVKISRFWDTPGDNLEES